MALRLLLDAHLSDAVANDLRGGGWDVLAAQADEVLRRLTDDELLAAAARERRALVSYNVRHFIPLARAWAESERSHWGIVLIHPRSIAQSDLGGQRRALERLLRRVPDEGGLRDGVMFLDSA